jgi:hypothetical protein
MTIASAPSPPSHGSRGATVWHSFNLLDTILYATGPRPARAAFRSREAE